MTSSVKAEMTAGDTTLVIRRETGSVILDGKDGRSAERETGPMLLIQIPSVPRQVVPLTESVSISSVVVRQGYTATTVMWRARPALIAADITHVHPRVSEFVCLDGKDYRCVWNEIGEARVMTRNVQMVKHVNLDIV